VGDEQETAASSGSRHHAYFAACSSSRRGAPVTDVCVPISRLAECVTEDRQDIEKSSLPIPLFATSRRQLPPVILIDRRNPRDREAKRSTVRVVRRALAMEGTAPRARRRHRKQAYLREDWRDVIDLMRDIKKLFDPENLMNQEKSCPWSTFSKEFQLRNECRETF